MIGRKEFFFFLGLLINLFLVFKSIKNLKVNNIVINDNLSISVIINKYCFNLFICYNLLSIPTALTHEAIIFLGLPLNIIITATLIGLNCSSQTVLVRTLLIYFPTIFASCLGLIFKVNAQIALGICQSWQEYNLFSDCQNQLPLVLKFFYMSISYAVKLVWKLNVASGNGAYFFRWIFVFTLNSLLLMRASGKTINKSVEQIYSKISLNDCKNIPSSFDILVSFSFKYVFIPFICSFILYIIALYWGRWFFIVSISYALCVLTPSLIDLEVASYQQNKWILNLLSPIYKPYFKIMLYIENKFLPKSLFLVYFPFLIYTVFFMAIPHYRIQISDLSNGIIPTVYNLVF